MRLFRKAARTGDQPDDRVEDPVVRQYRYLLRTAPVDALEHMHLEAFARMARADRAAVLHTVQEELVTGSRLEPDDVAALARLVVLGERRSPGALLQHCDAAVLRRLADLALVSEAAFGLLTGYAAWDGRDPEPPTEEEWEARRHRTWGDPAASAEARRSNEGHGPYGGAGSGGFGGGGDGSS
jgi:hypothetical protein